MLEAFIYSLISNFLFKFFTKGIQFRKADNIKHSFELILELKINKIKILFTLGNILKLKFKIIIVHCNQYIKY